MRQRQFAGLLRNSKFEKYPVVPEKYFIGAFLMISISQKNRWIKPLLAISMAFILSSLPAFAELGGTIASIKADQLKMSASLQVTSTSGYQLHEMQSPQGIRVREYASPNGTVFAVTWNGPWMPDLRQLFGPYFNQYMVAAQGKKAARGPVSIQLPGLVVERGGHARSFFGRAYVPQMIPQGVTADAIQ
jgi:uncharacterized protein DUF2844